MGIPTANNKHSTEVSIQEGLQSKRFRGKILKQVLRTFSGKEKKGSTWLRRQTSLAQRIRRTTGFRIQHRYNIFPLLSYPSMRHFPDHSRQLPYHPFTPCEIISPDTKSYSILPLKNYWAPPGCPKWNDMEGWSVIHMNFRVLGYPLMNDLLLKCLLCCHGYCKPCENSLSTYDAWVRIAPNLRARKVRVVCRRSRSFSTSLERKWVLGSAPKLS